MSPIYYAQLSGMAIVAASILSLLIAGEISEWRNV